MRTTKRCRSPAKWSQTSVQVIPHWYSTGVRWILNAIQRILIILNHFEASLSQQKNERQWSHSRMRDWLISSKKWSETVLTVSHTLRSVFTTSSQRLLSVARCQTGRSSSVSYCLANTLHCVQPRCIPNAMLTATRQPLKRRLWVVFC